jgi:hypothetical protein
MGFTGYDDVIASLSAGDGNRIEWFKSNMNVTGVANTWDTMWPMPGDPGAGSYAGSALTATAANNATVGSMGVSASVSPDTRHILHRSAYGIGATTVPGILLVYDRLLYYPTISASSNSQQNLTNVVTIPRYTTGVGVQAWLEITTNLGTGTGTFIMTYTSPEGGPKSLGASVATLASALQPMIPHTSGNTANRYLIPFLPLGGGDTGIVSVQSVQFTVAHSAGVVCLVLGVPLAMIPITVNSQMSERDYVLQMPSMPRVHDDACLGLLVYHSGALVANVPYQGNIRTGWS